MLKIFVGNFFLIISFLVFSEGNDFDESTIYPVYGKAVEEVSEAFKGKDISPTESFFPSVSNLEKRLDSAWTTRLWNAFRAGFGLLDIEYRQEAQYIRENLQNEHLTEEGLKQMEERIETLEAGQNDGFFHLSSDTLFYLIIATGTLVTSYIAYRLVRARYMNAVMAGLKPSRLINCLAQVMGIPADLKYNLQINNLSLGKAGKGKPLKYASKENNREVRLNMMMEADDNTY